MFAGRSKSTAPLRVEGTRQDGSFRLDESDLQPPTFNLQPSTPILSTFFSTSKNNTVNALMSFSDLPLELFRAILAEAIIARQMTAIRPMGREYESFKGILRLRLVNSEHLISNLSYSWERINGR
jgi:hypothetical protein